MTAHDPQLPVAATEVVDLDSGRLARMLADVGVDCTSPRDGQSRRESEDLAARLVGVMADRLD